MTADPDPVGDGQLPLTVYLDSGHSLTWSLPAADARGVAGAVRDYWAHRGQYRPGDLELAFGSGDEVTTWLHLAHVIGVSLEPPTPLEVTP